MSVFVARVVLDSGGDARSLIEGHDGYAVAGISLETAVALGQRLEMAPAEGVGHAHLIGDKSKSTSGLHP